MWGAKLDSNGHIWNTLEKVKKVKHGVRKRAKGKH